MAPRRVWRTTCCVSLKRKRERSMRSLIFAVATLVGVVMMASGSIHAF